MTEFPSHIEVRPGEYVETIGIELDAMVPGLTIEHRPGLTLTLSDSTERSKISGDHTPALADPDIAAHCGGGTPYILETWLLGSLAALTTRAFGRVTANLGWENVTFPVPGRDGETMLAESTIIDKRESRSRPNQGILHVQTRGLSRNGPELCRFERRLLVYRGPQGPRKYAGYV